MIDGSLALPLVRAVAAQYPALLQINTADSCYQFTTHVLAKLKAEGYAGWGYVGKTAPEGQFRPSVGFPRQAGPYTITGVSHDAIASPSQRVDLLGGGNDGPDPIGSPATPQWLEIPPENWRPNNPIIPFEGTAPPVTPPAPVVPPYPGDPVFDQIGVVLFADYAQAGQPPNPGMGRWFGRTTFDYLAGMPMADSIKKHRAEWREALGLPPL